MTSLQLPSGAVVTTTGTFTNIRDPRAWIQARGSQYVTWSERLTHILVGTEHNPCSWKLQRASSTATHATHIQILYESELPPPSTSLWVDLYRPTRLDDVIGHGQTAKDLMDWLRGFSAKSEYRMALLTGPPGIGKTTLAHLCAKSAGYEITEYNASDVRSASAIKEIFEKTSKASALPGQLGTSCKRLVIMDEVDGMSAGDRGGAAEIARLCKEKRLAFPVIAIANDRQSPKIRPLASIALDLRCARPTKTAIAKAIALKLNAAEGLSLRVPILEEMCERAGNDIRSVVNSLQFSNALPNATEGGNEGRGQKDAILRMDPFSATGRLFSASATLAEKEQAAFVDTGLVPLMVAEGYIAAAEKSRSAKNREDQLVAIAKAAEHLTTWDMLDTRIHRQQAWGLLPAATHAVVAAATIADGPAPFQIFPAWLGKNSKKLKHRRLLRELQGNTQIRGDPALMDTRDLLRQRLFRAGLGPKERVAELDAIGATRDDMLETLVETVFKGDEASVALDTKAKSALTREWKKVHPVLTTSKVASVATEEDVMDVWEDEDDE